MESTWHRLHWGRQHKRWLRLWTQAVIWCGPNACLAPLAMRKAAPSSIPQLPLPTKSSIVATTCAGYVCRWICCNCRNCSTTITTATARFLPSPLILPNLDFFLERSNIDHHHHHHVLILLVTSRTKNRVLLQAAALQGQRERERERVLMQALQGKLFQNRRVSGYVSYLITDSDIYIYIYMSPHFWENLRTGHIIIHKPAGSMLVISWKPLVLLSFCFWKNQNKRFFWFWNFFRKLKSEILLFPFFLIIIIF